MHRETQVFPLKNLTFIVARAVFDRIKLCLISTDWQVLCMLLGAKCHIVPLLELGQVC